jgi:hypothetical protein
MKLSNGKGLEYKMLGSRKHEDGSRTLTLLDPHTGKRFMLPAVTDELLKYLGYKVMR